MPIRDMALSLVTVETALLLPALAMSIAVSIGFQRVGLAD